MRHITRALLAQLLVLLIVTTSHAKTIQLPTFDIIEAIQKARQYVQDRKIDVSHHFLISAEYRNLHNEHEKGYWEITWALAAGAIEPRVVLRVSQDGSVSIADTASKDHELPQRR